MYIERLCFPNNKQNKKDDKSDYSKQTKKQLRKAKKSYEDLIKEHQEKLKDYKNDPYKYDNKGTLKNAPNQEVADKIIEGRIQALEKQIAKQVGELAKVNSWLNKK